MTRRAGVYLSEKVVCQTYHPPNHAWASQLGEPVLGEPVLIGRAIKRGWGEPSNEVGRATQPQPPRLLQSCALALRCLGTCPLGTVPARHV